eukprot:220209_1
MSDVFNSQSSVLSNDIGDQYTYCWPPPQTWTGGFKCEYCSQEFLLKQNLTQHITESHQLSIRDTPQMEIQHNLIPPPPPPPPPPPLTRMAGFKCEYCSQAFLVKESLTRHVAESHQLSIVAVKTEKPQTFIRTAPTGSQNNLMPPPPQLARMGGFKCQHCSQEFLVKDSLTRHVAESHQQSIVSVKTEEPSTFTGTSLTENQHNMIRPPPQPPTDNQNQIMDTQFGHEFMANCYFPQKNLNEPQNEMKAHQLGHNIGHTFWCNLCDKSFKYQCNLKQHLQSHSDERPFKCDICGKFCKSHRGMTLHQRTHSNLQPFYSQSDETQNVNENQHTQQRKSERLFPCSRCENSFESRSD